MAANADRALLLLVQSYFQEHLERVRGASRHTIFAYRDALKLFLQFLADSSSRPVAALDLDDIVVEKVMAFLDHLESARGNSVSTRNCRLAAVHGFSEHLLRNDPTRAAQYHRILTLPTKKARQRTASYLEPEDMRLFLGQPDCRTATGRRDHALFLFMYNTGTRISETLEVRWKDFRFPHPAQVRITGKGNRDRFCPIWPETVHALRKLGQDAHPEAHVFLNAKGLPLTRDGVAYLLHKYAKSAAQKRKTFRCLKVTPHMLRHSCAVALLQAGVDITVIRDYLGHASIATTSRYVSTNLQLKRQVLEAFWERSGLTKNSLPKQDHKADVMDFLDSL